MSDFASDTGAPPVFDSGPLPDGGAPPPVAPPPEAAAAPPPPPALHETPEFRDAVEAAVEARFQGLVANLPQPAAPQAQPGQQTDLNELLNPLNDNFGENLARFLADRDRWLDEQWANRLQPITAREEEAAIAQGQQRMDELISTGWNEQADGRLTPEVSTAIKDLAPTYLAEYEARYGAGPMAAEAALQKAAHTIRALNASARGAGAQSNADQLAAVAGTRTEPGTAGGAMQVQPPARSPREVFTRYFGGAVNGSQAAA